MNDYLATAIDLEAIEKAIKLVFSSKLSYIFKNKQLLEHFLLVSFDSKYLYLWTTENIHTVEKIKCSMKGIAAGKIPHKVTLSFEDRLGWKARVTSDYIWNLLPNNLKVNDFTLPKMSGSLLGDFLIQQIDKNQILNPYVTEESYTATLIHEFAHLYYNQHKNWWYSDKKYNVSLLDAALSLFENKKTTIPMPYTPSPLFFSELFAFCAEYAASEKLFSQHKKAMDTFSKQQIEMLREHELVKDLETENSSIGESTPHDTAMILGRIFLEKYPSNWPDILLTKPNY